MWKDNYKRNFIRNVIFAVLSVLLLIGLFIAMLAVRRHTEAQDAVLVEAYSQQQQEQSAARQEAVKAIDAEYDKDMQTVAEYLPGIVCWGDKITAGSDGNVSYPDVLQKYINTYICDVYNFRLSIEDADNYSRLKWDDYDVEIPVVNMGAGEEDSSTILGRSGVVPFIVSNDFVMPAGADKVEIHISSQNGHSVAPLTGGSAGVNNVNILGIEGTLSLDPDAFQYMSNKYYFSRTAAGAEMPVPAGTVISTAASELYRDYIHVICIGTYGGYDSTSELVEQTKAMVARQTANSDRYVVLGICSGNGNWGSGWSYTLDAIDTAMVQAFGSHYINVRKYLCTDGLTDAGISATREDLNNIQYGVVPESLRSVTGDAQLNGTAYELVGKLIYERMSKLGFFDEVEKELYIDEATKLLIAEDPEYFKKLLNK